MLITLLVTPTTAPEYTGCPLKGKLNQVEVFFFNVISWTPVGTFETDKEEEAWPMAVVAPRAATRPAQK
jgi:hypothetical protein